VAEMIPEPECAYGYTAEQLEQILGKDLERFYGWMYGQTMTLCQGEKYNHETKSYEEACGGIVHGPVVYSLDLARYLAGRTVVG